MTAASDTPIVPMNTTRNLRPVRALSPLVRYGEGVTRGTIADGTAVSTGRLSFAAGEMLVARGRLPWERWRSVRREQRQTHRANRSLKLFLGRSDCFSFRIRSRTRHPRLW